MTTALVVDADPDRGRAPEDEWQAAVIDVDADRYELRASRAAALPGSALGELCGGSYAGAPDQGDPAGERLGKRVDRDVHRLPGPDPTDACLVNLGFDPQVCRVD